MSVLLFPTNFSFYSIAIPLFPEACSLFPVACSLFPVAHSLFPVACSLFQVACSLFPVAYSLFPVAHSLFPVACSLFPVACSLFPVACSLFPILDLIFCATHLLFLNGQKTDPIAIGLTLLHKLFLYDVLSIRQKIILTDFRLRRNKFTEVSRRSTQIKHLTFVANLPAFENFLKLVKYFL